MDNMVWSEEVMGRVQASVSRAWTKRGEVSQLVSLRFQDDGLVAITDRIKYDEYGEVDPNGEWYYQLFWIRPVGKDKRVNSAVIEDGLDSGDQYEFGGVERYESDKLVMAADHPLYIWRDFPSNE